MVYFEMFAKSSYRQKGKYNKLIEFITRKPSFLGIKF